MHQSQVLMQWGRAYYAELSHQLTHWSDEDLRQPLPVPWAVVVEVRLGRAPATTAAEETALQVALHSMYHRGQVNARLREAGGSPPLVDYIAWVWVGRPAAAWPLVDPAARCSMRA